MSKTQHRNQKQAYKPNNTSISYNSNKNKNNFEK